MKAFVTGGTGFIGQRLVAKLLERDHEVVALARSGKSAATLSAMGAEVVRGDILDVDSMREGMDGCDIVYHLAGWYKIGASDWMNAEAINVSGTRRVLNLAHELGIPKIVYTSSVVVFGDTNGKLVDEHYFKGGPFITEFDRTKWLAHYKVALPLIEKGAPIIIVMPGATYGPGDHSWVGEAMRYFYQGRLAAVPGPEFTVTYAHVDDIAEGHILAAEKGKIGESYILAGPAVPFGEMVDFWAQLTGRSSPMVRIPSRVMQPVAPVMSSLGTVLPVPQTLSEEAIHEMSATYMARADKARVELGWQTRSLQDGMSETFNWIAETTPLEPLIVDKERKIAGLALLTAAALLVAWLLSRRRK